MFCHGPLTSLLSPRPPPAPTPGQPDSRISRIDLVSHGPQPSPRLPSRGPTLIPGTAAAGGAWTEPLKPPRESRLDPGSGAGVTWEACEPRRKCHVLSWSAGPPVGPPPVRVLHAAPPSHFVPLRSVRPAAVPASGTLFPRVSRAPAPGLGRAFAPARFARLIAPTREPRRRAHVSRSFLRGPFFRAGANRERKQPRADAASFFPSQYREGFPGVKMFLT